MAVVVNSYCSARIAARATAVLDRDLTRPATCSRSPRLDGWQLQTDCGRSGLALERQRPPEAVTRRSSTRPPAVHRNQPVAGGSSRQARAATRATRHGQLLSTVTGCHRPSSASHVVTVNVGDAACPAHRRRPYDDKVRHWMNNAGASEGTMPNRIRPATSARSMSTSARMLSMSASRISRWPRTTLPSSANLIPLRSR